MEVPGPPTFVYLRGLRGELFPRKWARGSSPPCFPSFRYYAVIERDIDDETLRRMKVLVAAVIYLEKRGTPEDLSAANDEALAMIADEHGEAFRMFVTWLNRMLAKHNRGRGRYRNRYRNGMGFGHEKPDVYRAAIEYVGSTDGDRRRSFEIARGSALECGAVQLVLRVCRALPAEDQAQYTSGIDPDTDGNGKRTVRQPFPGDDA